MLILVIVVVAFACVVVYFSGFVTPDKFTFYFRGYQYTGDMSVIIIVTVLVTSIVVALVAWAEQSSIRRKLSIYQSEIAKHDAAVEEYEGRIAEQESELKELRRRITSLESIKRGGPELPVGEVVEEEERKGDI